jgi:poly-gamma-glutamate synthesis protein (capsule biosynthesis protein)
VIQLRALARRGADAVIAHHPHVPQGVEWMGNVPIVYSLGNFVFMQRQRWTDRGLWAELVFTPGAYRPSLTILPLVVGYTPSFATGADSARVMRQMDSLSRRIPVRPRVPGRPAPRRTLRPR